MKSHEPLQHKPTSAGVAPIQRRAAPATFGSAGWAVQAQGSYGNAFVQALVGDDVQAEGDLQAEGAFQAEGGGGGDVHAVASAGVSGGGGALPHLDAIQSSFGGHDVSGVQAHVGGAAADASSALGAEAYATGNNVAFQASPSLHTAAHEAAHVVQQRAGVSLKGGVGQAGDRYEQHADAVADAVVQGNSAEGLLNKMAGPAAGGGGVQQKAVQREGDEDTDTPKHDTSDLSVDKTKLEQLGTAIKTALQMVKNAIGKTKLGDAAYKLWMDSGAAADTADADTKARVAHVLTGYEAIKKCLEKDEVIFKKWELPADHKFKYDTTYAYVRGGEAENNIYLGGAFWVANNEGLDSKAGTIVHELSHRLHATKDHHYGAANSKQSAKDTPAKATTNADNYEHFGESA